MDDADFIVYQHARIVAAYARITGMQAENMARAACLYGKRVTEAAHYAQTCLYQFIMSKPYPDTVETAQ